MMPDRSDGAKIWTTPEGEDVMSGGKAVSCVLVLWCLLMIGCHWEYTGKNPSGVWKDDGTGLMWEDPLQKPVEMEWEEAISYCDALVAGGFDDWRLPSLDELVSLRRGCNADTGFECRTFDGPGQEGCYWDPAIGITPYAPYCGFMWSRNGEKGGSAQSLLFTSGRIEAIPTNMGNQVRCVRSAAETIL
jgi:hypothetical protein